MNMLQGGINKHRTFSGYSVELSVNTERGKKTENIYWIIVGV